MGEKRHFNLEGFHASFMIAKETVVTSTDTFWRENHAHVILVLDYVAVSLQHMMRAL